MLAAEGGHAETVKALIEAGADVQDFTESDGVRSRVVIFHYDEHY